jgi:hypothetical protein
VPEKDQIKLFCLLSRPDDLAITLILVQAHIPGGLSGYGHHETCFWQIAAVYPTGAMSCTHYFNYMLEVLNESEDISDL